MIDTGYLAFVLFVFGGLPGPDLELYQGNSG